MGIHRYPGAEDILCKGEGSALVSLLQNQGFETGFLKIGGAGDPVDSRTYNNSIIIFLYHTPSFRIRVNMELRTRSRRITGLENSIRNEKGRTNK
jgi:hypothetical protein